MDSPALRVFSPEEYKRVKLLLATQVADMMGCKLEEEDWNRVYCEAKGIPHSGWSNLNIDVIHAGLGVEQKLLCVSRQRAQRINQISLWNNTNASRSDEVDKGR